MAAERADDVPEGYRPCVGVALFNAAGLVLVGERAGSARQREDSLYRWQMPQGGIDPGETFEEAARRELYEETNVRSAALIGWTPSWLLYDLPTDLAGRSWRGRYRGQAQKWVAFRFTGPDSEIDVLRPAGGHARPEFRAWRWEHLSRTPDLIVPFKRRVYEAVAERFARHALLVE